MTSYSECMGEFGWDARYEAERNKRERITRLRPDEPCGYHPACLSHHTKPCEGCGRTAGRLLGAAPRQEKEEADDQV